MRKRRGWSELEKYVCILYMWVCRCLCMFVDSWRWDKSSSWHASSGVSSVHLPLRRGENTNNTNPLTHMEIYIIPMRLVYLPIQLSTLPCSLSLLPSSFCFWLSVLWLAGPLWSSRSPAVISSWWWWTTSVTAACLSQSPWTPSKSCISFTGQRLWTTTVCKLVKLVSWVRGSGIRMIWSYIWQGSEDS